MNLFSPGNLLRARYLPLHLTLVHVSPSAVVWTSLQPLVSRLTRFEPRSFFFYQSVSLECYSCFTCDR